MDTQDNRSIPELTKDVAAHLGDMFRNELKLARVEATEGAKSLGGGVAKVAAGAVVAISALTLALMAIASALSEVMPTWAANGIVALVAAIVAWMLVKSGQKALTKGDVTLPRTRSQVARDVEAVKEQVH